MMLRTIKPSLIYFGIVFGIGFVLGMIRVIFLVPLIGERWAELLEIPFMLVAITYTAKYLVRKYPLLRMRDWLSVGLQALFILLSVEFTIVLGLRGISLAEYFDSRDIISGSVYLISLIIYTLMPLYIYKYHTRVS